MRVKGFSLYLFIAIVVSLLYLVKGKLICAAESSQPGTGHPTSKLWVTAYYPEFGDLSPSPSEIDWSAFTHIVIFTCGMNASAPPYFREMPGTADSENFDGGYSKRINWVKAVVDSAHRHGVKALMCVAGLGGSPSVTGPGSTGDMETVMNTPAMRHAFISYVAGSRGFARRRNLDGFDFDFEYPGSTDEGYKMFIRELRDTLDHWPVPGFITTAVPIWRTPVFSGDTAWANNEFDQINIMAYGLADGSSVTGFNSPLVPNDTKYSNYNGSSWFRNGYGHGPWDGWVKYGIRASKIGVIIPFEMRHVTGNDAPGQTRVGNSAYANYSEVLQAMSANPFYHPQWDPISRVPWFGYDDGAGKHYFTYENRASIEAKVDTIRNGGFGGVGVWELFRGYVPNGTPPDELLQDLKHAVGS